DRSDYRNDSRVEVFIIDYLDSNQITYDDFAIFSDANFENGFNGYYTEDMTLYVQIIIFERMDLYVHVLDSGFFIEGLIVDKEFYSMNYFVYEYLNEQMIDYDDYDIYEDANFEV